MHSTQQNVKYFLNKLGWGAVHCTDFIQAQYLYLIFVLVLDLCPWWFLDSLIPWFLNSCPAPDLSHQITAICGNILIVTWPRDVILWRDVTPWRDSVTWPRTVTWPRDTWRKCQRTGQPQAAGLSDQNCRGFWAEGWQYLRLENFNLNFMIRSEWSKDT